MARSSCRRRHVGAGRGADSVGRAAGCKPPKSQKATGVAAAVPARDPFPPAPGPRAPTAPPVPRARRSTAASELPTSATPARSRRGVDAGGAHGRARNRGRRLGHRDLVSARWTVRLSSITVVHGQRLRRKDRVCAGAQQLVDRRRAGQRGSSYFVHRARQHLGFEWRRIRPARTR